MCGGFPAVGVPAPKPYIATVFFSAFSFFFNISTITRYTAAVGPVHGITYPSILSRCLPSDITCFTVYSIPSHPSPYTVASSFFASRLFSVSRFSSAKSDHFNVNIKAGASMLTTKVCTSGKELQTISYTLQELLQKLL